MRQHSTCKSAPPMLQRCAPTVHCSVTEVAQVASWRRLNDISSLSLLVVPDYRRLGLMRKENSCRLPSLCRGHGSPVKRHGDPRQQGWRNCSCDVDCGHVRQDIVVVRDHCYLCCQHGWLVLRHEPVLSPSRAEQLRTAYLWIVGLINIPNNHQLRSVQHTDPLHSQ